MTESNKFIEELKMGSESAFEELIDQYQHKVYHTCLSFVPNKEDAEDIAQEVFFEVYRSIGKFKAKSKLSTWIYKISTQKSLEFLRKKNAKKRLGFLLRISGSKLPLYHTQYFTEFNHPGVQLENKELTETIFQAINSLPENQKLIFTLVKIDGKTYQEVTEITGKTLSSVESILFRAKRNLQKKLEELNKN